MAAPGLAVTEHELAEILTLPAFALHAREGGRGMQPKRGSLNTPPMSCGGPRGLPVRREAARARTADFAIRHTKRDLHRQGCVSYEGAFAAERQSIAASRLRGELPA